jgi:hypothetical protein
MHDWNPEIDGEVDTPFGKPQCICPCCGIGINEGHVRGNCGDFESEILSPVRDAAPCLLICFGGDMRSCPGKCLGVELDGIVAVTGNHYHGFLDGKLVECHGVKCGSHDACGPFQPVAENETGFLIEVRWRDLIDGQRQVDPTSLAHREIGGQHDLQ